MTACAPLSVIPGEAAEGVRDPGPRGRTLRAGRLWVPALRFAAAGMTAFGLLSTSALACSCVERSAADQVVQSEVIFVGTPKETVASDEEGSSTVYTIFRVTEMLKGEKTDELFLFHPKDLGGNCGIDFADGKSVLVMANDDSDNPMSTDLCTMPHASEAEVRAALKQASPGK